MRIISASLLPHFSFFVALSHLACSSGEGPDEDGGQSGVGGSVLGASGGTGGEPTAGGGGTAAGGGGVGGGVGTGGMGTGGMVENPTYCERWQALSGGDLPGFATDSECHEFADIAPGDATCSGAQNGSATIDRVELAQNHVLTPTADDYTTNESGNALGGDSVRPQFRLISHRPALLLVTVTGSGAAPEVSVRALRNGSEVGSFCLSGPDMLPASVGGAPNLDQQYSVNLPAEWIRSGLSLEVTAGGATSTISSDQLRVGGGTRHIVMEGSMVLYGLEPRTVPKDDPDDYIMADELPVQSAVWAHFPVPIIMDPMTMSARSGNPARIVTVKEGSFDEVGEVLDIFAQIWRANGHEDDAAYYASFPDGWGGGLGGRGLGSAGPPSQLMIRHETGHSYGLPHLEDAYADGRYPFAKRTNGSGCVLDVEGEGGCGVGPAWKYFQTAGTFENPWDDEGGGVYKRDPMAGGGNNWFGQYTDQWLLDYFSERPYFDLETETYMTYDEGTGEFVPETNVEADNYYRRPEQRDTPLYTIFGSYSDSVSQVNVIQPPLHYRGHLLKTIDPNEAADIQWLKDNAVSDACRNRCDFVLRVTFDGSVTRDVLVNRGAGEYTRWAINVPDLGTITRAELFRRHLDNGNIGAATVENYFDSAVSVASRDF